MYPTSGNQIRITGVIVFLCRSVCVNIYVRICVCMVIYLEKSLMAAVFV